MWTNDCIRRGGSFFLESARLIVYELLVWWFTIPQIPEADWLKPASLVRERGEMQRTDGWRAACKQTTTRSATILSVHSAAQLDACYLPGNTNSKGEARTGKQKRTNLKFLKLNHRRHLKGRISSAYFQIFSIQFVALPLPNFREGTRIIFQHVSHNYRRTCTRTILPINIIQYPTQKMRGS